MFGQELKDLGKVFDSEELMVVHHNVPAGGKIPSHNHDGQLIFFTVVKGDLDVYLNNEEKHHMSPGTVLHFDGTNFISADALEDSDIFVYLVNKR